MRFFCFVLFYFYLVRNAGCEVQEVQDMRIRGQGHRVGVLCYGWKTPQSKLVFQLLLSREA